MGKRIALRLCAGAGVVCALAISSISYGQSASETMNYFGSLGQASATVTNTNAAYMGVYNQYSVAIGPNACCPTAVIGGLTYLENYDNVTNDTDPFTTSPNSAAQINNLATAMNTYNTTNSTGNPMWTNVGGTLIPSSFNGLQSYLSSTGANPAPTVTISGQVSPSTPAPLLQTSLANTAAGTYNAGTNVANVTPTAQFLANALAANDGVEIGIQWGSYSGTTFTPMNGGGHMLTLQSINMSGGTGTIDFYDPWGPGTNAGTTNGYVFATVSTVDGFLYVTYPITWTGGDLDNSGNTSPFEAIGASTGQTGRIVYDMVEAVPEPTSGVLAVAGLLAGSRRLRRRG